MPTETKETHEEWTVTRMMTLQEQICECIDKLGTLLTMHVKSTEALAAANNRIVELERTTDSLIQHNGALSSRITTLESEITVAMNTSRLNSEAGIHVCNKLQKIAERLDTLERQADDA